MVKKQKENPLRLREALLIDVNTSGRSQRNKIFTRGLFKIFQSDDNSSLLKQTKILERC